MFEAQRLQLKKAVKVKTKSHLIFNILSSATIATLFNPAVITGVVSTPTITIACWIISFLSVMITLAYTRPIYKSVFWFYRLAVFCFCSKSLYFLAEFFYEGYNNVNASFASIQRDLSFWFAVWLIPLLMIYLYSRIRNAILGHLSAPHGKFVDGLYSFFTTYSIHISSAKSEGKTKLSPKSVVCIAVSTFLFFLGAALYAAAKWTDKYFGNIGFAAVIFNIKYSPNTAGNAVLSGISVYVLIVIVVTSVFFAYLLRRMQFGHLTVFTIDKKSSCRIRIFSKPNFGACIMGICAFVHGAVICVDAVGLYDYVKLKLQKSTIYEDYYVVPTAENVIFPDSKRNLIYIYLESMENTFSSYEIGGNYEIDYMPELTKLAVENLNFSHSNLLGGQSVFFSETAYTMGSTVAQTAGVALVTPMGLSKNAMDHYSDFLPGLTTLEDILHENGYNQLFIRGENTSFAGYSSYVGKYENSSIFDYNYALDNGYIPNDYYVHWGFEDLKLFDFAKVETLRLSEQNAPFCITLYTADTHGLEQGYECEACENPYDNTYANAIACSSKLTYEYIVWLSEQSFFENTTIIICGDHLSELPTSNGFIKEDDYVRTTYNCIINPAAVPASTKNRTFSALDMFPTTLSAIGVEIAGDRLGLGTDLFSSTPTLCEELGSDVFITEIQKRSDYYNKNFWLIAI